MQAINLAKKILDGLQPFMSRRNIVTILMLIILLLATSIRLLGIRYGLPYTFHTDEPTILDRALRMLRVGDYNPHFFNYPSLTIYLQAIVYALYFMVRVTKHTTHIIHIEDMPNHFFYLPGRLATTLIGIMTVGLTYFVGKRMYGEEKGTRIGLVAALFLAVTPIHVEESRWITPNVPTGFFVLLSFYFAYLVWEKGEWYHYLFAGLSAGLAASSKYNGLLVIVSLLIAHLLSSKSEHAYLLLGVMVFPIGFLMGTPYALIDPAQFLFGFRGEQIHYKFYGHPGAEYDFWWYGRYLYQTGGLLLSLTIITGFIYGFFEHWRKHLILIAFPCTYFTIISSYLVKFERNLVPMVPFLALCGALGVEVGYKLLSIYLFRNFRVKYGLLALIRIMMPFVLIVHPVSLAVRYGLLLTRTDTIVMTAQWVTAHLPNNSIVCTGYEEFAPRYIPPIPETQFIVLPIPYEQLKTAPSAFYTLCNYFIANEQLFAPLPEWKLLQRFDPVTLNHPGRRFGIYEIPSDKSKVVDEILEDFNDPGILSRLQWQQGAEKATATIAESALTIAYPNTPKVADVVFFDFPLNIDLKGGLALLLHIRLALGSYLTMETIVDGQYWCPPYLNYYQGTGEWTTIAVPLPSGHQLNAIRISVSEPDEIPITPWYSLSIDWLKIRRIIAERSEIVLENFEENFGDKWSAFGMNNVQGKFTVQDGILTLAYENNLSQEDIYAYVYNLPQPLAGVAALKMRVKIYPGTLFTVDVVKNGELVAPRFLNYYPGTGEWEEIVIPVDGRLDSITISIGESGGQTTTPSYRIDIDWIKAIVSK